MDRGRDGEARGAERKRKRRRRGRSSSAAPSATSAGGNLDVSAPSRTAATEPSPGRADGGAAHGPTAGLSRKGKRRRRRHDPARQEKGVIGATAPLDAGAAVGAAAGGHGTNRGPSTAAPSAPAQAARGQAGRSQPVRGPAAGTKGRPRSLQGRPLPAHEAKGASMRPSASSAGSAGRGDVPSLSAAVELHGPSPAAHRAASHQSDAAGETGAGWPASAGAGGLARPRPFSQNAGPDGPRGKAGDSGDGADAAPLYAALDLGTNNCRLLIAQPTRPGQFRVVDAFSRIVRLGEGLAASGRLSEEAMHRAVEALKVCAVKLAGRPVRRRRLIATEAARQAENGAAFMARVADETGLELEIIDRETEARLAVSGCSSLVGREARSVVLFDIGGGSSEIAVLKIGESRSPRLANHITHWTSLPVGVVTLSERHGGRDVTPERFEAMVQEVEGMLAGFDCPAIDDPGLSAGGKGDFYLIGTSGTVTTLAGVHLDLPRYDRRRVDGVWLSDEEVTAMQARLLSWDFAARAANPCIGPDRADLVLAGCAILEAIRRRWPSTRMRVADRGLREGLLTDMMADDGVWRRGRPRRGA
ncbi:exopolyphosphatase [Rhizobium sp. YIM 134829]|uniref:Ppx/GppA phosphatase family protein n=1 Tax=Rhizobium sp. YIM 134829 TaxID=3390453 RepID=UPI00397B8862